MNLGKLFLCELAESKYDDYMEILKRLGVFEVVDDYESHNENVYVSDEQYIMAKRLVEMMENAICFIQCFREIDILKGKYEYLDKEIAELEKYYDKNEISNFDLIEKYAEVHKNNGKEKRNAKMAIYSGYKNDK